MSPMSLGVTMLQGISAKSCHVDVKFVVSFLEKKSPVFLDQHIILSTLKSYSLWGHSYLASRGFLIILDKLGRGGPFLFLTYLGISKGLCLQDRRQ